MLLVLAIVIIGPKEVKVFKEDKVTYIKDLTSRLSRSTAKSFLNRINTLQDKLIIFTSYRESLSHTAVKIEDHAAVLFSQEQEFLAINLLRVDERNVVTVSWALRNNQSPDSRAWPADFERTVATQLNLAKAEGKGRALWVVKGPDGEELYVYGLRVEIAATPTNPPSPPLKTWITGVLARNAFDDLFSDFATGVNKAYILDENGVAVATSDSAVKLKSLKDQPLFADALVQSKEGGANEYKLDGHAVMASSDGIYKTNLVVVVTTPEDKAFDAAGAISRSVFFIGLTLILFGLGLTILFSNFFLTGPLKKIAMAVDDMSRGRFNTPIDILNRDELGELSESLKNIEGGLGKKAELKVEDQSAALHDARMSAFNQLSAGISNEIKNPLAGILGYIQLALTKTSSEEAKNHLALAEREVRRCKGVIESLGRLSQVEKSIPQMTNLAQMVQDALLSLDHQIGLAHCKVYKDFRPCPTVNLDPQLFQQVVSNLITNAIQAMETTSEKNLTVRVMEVSGHAQVHISDTGTGINPTLKSKIFEPFFTTKSLTKGMGLGLAVARGIIKEFKGEITFKPGAEGLGTDFVIELPLPEKRVMAEKVIEPKPMEPEDDHTISVTMPVMNLSSSPKQQSKPAPPSMPATPTTIAMPKLVLSDVPKMPPAPEGHAAPAMATIPKMPDAPTMPKAVSPAAPIPVEVKLTGREETPNPVEMPPVPEEAIFLEKIRPNTIPIPNVGIPVEVPKASMKKEGEPIKEVPPVVQVTTPTVRNVPEFKVAIRRPKLRL
jgi:signal transduction histidine kinase